MRPRLFTIHRDGPGALSTMARPRGGDWLPTELSALAVAGVDVLVSLLSDAEVRELALEQEEHYASTVGIHFLRLATSDRAVPDRSATIDLADDLAGRLARGAGVAIHCRHGIGRSSTLAASVLVREGLAPADAWRRVSQARGLPVPDTPAQRALVETLPPADPLPADPPPGTTGRAGQS